MIPDNVETITMTKADYDRNVEKLLLDKLELEQRIDEATEFIKEYHKHRDSFKWNEQDYIDVIDEIEKILGGNNE